MSLIWILFSKSIETKKQNLTLLTNIYKPKTSHCPVDTSESRADSLPGWWVAAWRSDLLHTVLRHNPWCEVDFESRKSLLMGKLDYTLTLILWYLGLFCGVTEKAKWYEFAFGNWAMSFWVMRGFQVNQEIHNTHLWDQKWTSEVDSVWIIAKEILVFRLVGNILSLGVWTTILGVKSSAII